MSAALAFAQRQQDLVRIGAAQKDLRPRFLNFAADFFKQIAEGEKPPKPDKFVAEVTAEIIAESVGEEVPLPLPDAGAAKRLAAGKPLPTDAVEELPEAQVWLTSAGFSPGRKPSRASIRLMSLLLGAPPTTEWKAKDLSVRLGKTRTSVTRLLQEFRAAGLVTSEGEKSACVWKRSEMPPHV